MASRPEFSDTDLQSSLWLKLRAYYQARLEELRRKNDGALTPEETTRLRGRIAEIKQILALADRPPPTETNDA